MRAIILAGGKGVRLRPFTTLIPKPLIPIEDIPITEILIGQLKYYGFNRVTLAVGYMAEMIKAYFKDGKKWQVKIDYVKEDKPLGTIGPLAKIKFKEDDILVLNSDILTDLNFTDFTNYHKKMKSLMTVALHRRDIKVEYGVIERDNANLVVDYIEKPTLHYNVSMGIYAINKQALRYIPKNKKYDMPDFIKELLRNKKKILAYESKDYWLDIGSPSEYERAVDEFKTKKKRLLKSVH